MTSGLIKRKITCLPERSLGWYLTTTLLLIAVISCVVVLYHLYSGRQNSNTCATCCPGLGIERVYSFNKVVPAQTVKDINLIMVSTSFDCSSCVESAANICNDIKFEFKENISVTYISRTPDKLGLVFINGVHTLIDETENIRTELKLSYSPKLILLDRWGNILCCIDVSINKKEVNELKRMLEKTIENLINPLLSNKPNK